METGIGLLIRGGTRMVSAYPSIRKPAILASMVCLAIQGCGIPLWESVRPVPVEEVDARGISLARVQKLKRGDRAASIVDILGEPADRRQSCVPGEVIWRYPIRAWNEVGNGREIVPAIILRISFDGFGKLADWRFLDPFWGRPLAVRETADDASGWFKSLSQAPPPIPERIELDKTLIPGRTTQLDVERILGGWQPDFYCGGGGLAPVVKKTAIDSVSVWDWYVDRPSPLFIPPRYLVVCVDDAGALIVWHFEQTYPGGRK
jgi:hypothetical protein